MATASGAELVQPADIKQSSARWAVLAVISIATFITFLDNTVINAALPSIARDLEASNTTLQWIVDGYVLALAGLLLVGGTMGDKFGRKKMLALGLVIFAGGSVGGGLATSTGLLIAMRAVQGVGAALILPATFPREERSKAIGIWTGVGALGLVTGPVLGGLLVDEIDWSAVFWMHLPVIGVALLGLRIVPESRDERLLKFDIPGAVFGSTALVALIFGFIQEGDAGWGDPVPVGAFVIAAALFGGFIWVEGRNPSPMLPLKFFRQKDYTGSLVVILLIFFAMIGLFFFLTQYFQIVQGKSAFGPD